MSFLLSLIAAASLASSAAPLDPVDVVDDAAQQRGDRSEVLVLGTAHLSGLPADYDREVFDPLLERLQEWAPEAIANEALSGPQCDYLRAHSFAYEGTADEYCPDPTPARLALGLTGAQAEQEVEALLAAPVAERTPGQRRRMAALFLAMGEPTSALVQWHRLAEKERRADEHLNPFLVEMLQRRGQGRDEDSIIASRLAARLGLERVYPVDDHTGDRASGISDDNIFGAEIAEIWDNDAVKRLLERSERSQHAFLESGDVLAWYRAINDPSQMSDTMAGDFGAAAGSKLPGNTGRRYLAYWETRNLRMVGNLREVIGPGRRVLAIVGASHVPYYHRYLGMMSDVELVDLTKVLDD